jgi:hypothetical protein
MLHALLATIGTLAILVSIVVKLVLRPAEAAEGDAPVVPSARGDLPCHRVRGRREVGAQRRQLSCIVSCSRAAARCGSSSPQR